jgi:hypothetical protein
MCSNGRPAYYEGGHPPIEHGPPYTNLGERRRRSREGVFFRGIDADDRVQAAVTLLTRTVALAHSSRIGSDGPEKRPSFEAGASL